MMSSLDLLMNNLVHGGPQGLSRGSRKLVGFEDYNESQYDLLTRKGI